MLRVSRWSQKPGRHQTVNTLGARSAHLFLIGLVIGDARGVEIPDHLDLFGHPGASRTGLLVAIEDQTGAALGSWALTSKVALLLVEYVDNVYSCNMRVILVQLVADSRRGGANGR